MAATPWPIEGFRAYYGEDTQSQILKTSQIQSYLAVGNHEEKFFLIGSKGLGKTLLLRYKSHLYHEQLGGDYKFNTSSSELTENLEIQTHTFSRDELLQFRHLHDWESLWKLSLWTLVFKIYGLDINPELDKMIDKSSKLSSIFSELISNRDKISQFPKMINEFVNRAGEIKSGVAIFIDDVDQAFEDIMINNHHYNSFYSDGQSKPAVEIWVNGQNALISSIYSIHRQNRHIKIFATIRAEAFHCLKVALRPNYLHHAVMLRYDKWNIEEIFSKNIQLIPKEKLAKPDGKTWIEKFLGFEEMPHRFAKDHVGNPRIESAFNFIFRHTYGRPREIVQMGSSLDNLVTQPYYKSLSLYDKIEEVRANVTVFAHGLFNEYKQQIIPGFDTEELKVFFRSIPGNVIPRSKLEELNPHSLKLYYSLGLLGFTKANPDGKKLVQDFLPAAEYTYTELAELPSAPEFFVTHPTMDEELLRETSYGSFYNGTNIIGKGYPFDNHEPILHKECEHFVPAEFPGARGEAPNMAAGHKFPLKEYYQHFFNIQDTRFRNRYLEQAKLAKEILSKLARLCYFNRLRKVSNDFYTAQVSNMQSEIKNYVIVRTYNSPMDEESLASDEDKFLDKLFGRLIALGAILYLDLHLASVKKLLRDGKVEFKIGIDQDRDAVYHYSYRSFFIPRLSRSYNVRDEAESNGGKLNKQAIFDALSPFEKKFFSDLYKEVIEEVRMLAPLFEKPEDIDWLKENVLDRIWKSASE